MIDWIKTYWPDFKQAIGSAYTIREFRIAGIVLFYLVLIGVVFVLTGCDSSNHMYETFEVQKKYIFTYDKTGEKYVISHRFGSNYSVRPCDEVFAFCDELRAKE